MSLTLIALSGAFARISAQNLPRNASASISGRVTLSGKPARKIKETLVLRLYGSPETPGRQSVVTDTDGKPLILKRVRLINVAPDGKQQALRPLGNEEMFTTDDRGVYRILELHGKLTSLKSAWPTLKGHLVPSETEASANVLRYAEATPASDGAFAFLPFVTR